MRLGLPHTVTKSKMEIPSTFFSSGRQRPAWSKTVPQCQQHDRLSSQCLLVLINLINISPDHSDIGTLASLSSWYLLFFSQAREWPWPSPESSAKDKNTWNSSSCNHELYVMLINKEIYFILVHILV